MECVRPDCNKSGVLAGLEYEILNSLDVQMSAIGTKRTFLLALHMSAFGGKADIAPASQNVRL